jgi:hypothetical protein
MGQKLDEEKALRELQIVDASVVTMGLQLVGRRML